MGSISFVVPEAGVDDRRRVQVAAGSSWRATLDARFWTTAAIGTLAALLVLGIPTAVVPTSFFTRMTPTDFVNATVWLASAPLIGLLLATYVAAPRLGRVHRPGHEREAGVVGKASIGGVGAFLAIGCPLCNKIVIAALGVSGALNVFAPLQPVIGGVSVALLASALVVRLRARGRACERCATDRA